MSSTLARPTSVPPIGTPPQRGFTAVEFVCPACGALKWGTTRGRGHCNGCGFSWARTSDWLYFRLLNGSHFVSAAGFARIVEGRTFERPQVTPIGNLRDLLGAK